MNQVNIFRVQKSNQGTEGILVSDGFICRTLELPWKDNKKSISCIPPGEYNVEIRYSKKYRKVFWVRKVPNRTYILIHSGNFGGDKNQGYKSHSTGCILLGERRGILNNQIAVLNSRVTIKQFMINMKYEPFKLKIQNVY